MQKNCLALLKKWRAEQISLNYERKICNQFTNVTSIIQVLWVRRILI